MASLPSGTLMVFSVFRLHLLPPYSSIISGFFMLAQASTEWVRFPTLQVIHLPPLPFPASSPPEVVPLLSSLCFGKQPIFQSNATSSVVLSTC